jgi:hypothetical protein
MLPANATVNEGGTRPDWRYTPVDLGGRGFFVVTDRGSAQNGAGIADRAAAALPMAHPRLLGPLGRSRRRRDSARCGAHGQLTR